MAEQSAEDTTTTFHVEEQEVIYWTSSIDATNKDAAHVLVIENRGGEVVGCKSVSRLVTNVHPVTDKCAEHGCYEKPSER